MGGANVRNDVLRLFTSNPNRILYVEDMAEQLGRTPDSIRNCVYNMRKNVRGLAELILVFVPGRAWRYIPSESSVEQLAMPLPLAESTNGRSINVPVDTATRPVQSPEPVIDTPVDAYVASTKSGRYFEELGTNTEGDVIVVDENGEPYKLTPLGDVGDVH